MCVLAFSFEPGDGLNAPSLVLIANRDEFYSRPTQSLRWWSVDSAGARPGILAGRDLKGGGTWLAVNRAGRVAILTNFRDPTQDRTEKRSRGNLVEQWVAESFANFGSQALAEKLALQADDYAGFSLLLFDFSRKTGGQAWILSNRSSPTLTKLDTGMHGLSNHLLDSPWPKSNLLKETLRACLALPLSAQREGIYAALQSGTRPHDAELPRTGISLERERYLSSVFIQALDQKDPLAYGTRTSSMLTIRGDSVNFEERTWQPTPVTREFAFELD